VHQEIEFAQYTIRFTQISQTTLSGIDSKGHQWNWFRDQADLVSIMAAACKNEKEAPTGRVISVERHTRSSAS